MTTEIGSLAVSLSMDASNFNGSINQMNRHLGAMGSELRAAKALGTDYGKSIEGLTSKKDILTRSVATSSVKLTEERRKYDELVASGTANEATLERQARRVNEAQVQYNRLSTELNEVTEDLRIQSSAWTQVGDRMQAVGGRMTAIGEGMTNVGKNLSMYVTAPIVAAGVASAKLAIDFEAQMDRVGAIAGATAGEMDALNASALKLGAETSKSASEVAVAMEDMAAMGFNAVEIIGAMPGVISASEASGESLALAAQTVAAALNVWGLEASEASRVADVLAMAANMSAAGINDMQLAFKYAGAPAAALGIELEEVAAAVGIMTDAGLDGSNAGTALRASLLALNNPAKAQEKIMKQLGFSILDADGNAKSLSNMVGDLSKSLEGETEAQKVATLAKLVGTEAVSGFLALIKAGPTNIDKMTKALENSGGASAETAKKMKDNLKGALEELGGTIETAAITIGGILTPSIKKASDTIQGLVEKFQDLSPEAQKTILAIGGVVAAAGPLLVVGGTIMSGVGGTVTAFGALSGAIGGAGGLGAALLGLAGPLGWTVAGIGLATAGTLAFVGFLKKEGLPEIELFGDGVSESTQKAVTGFVELNDKATVELNKLAWGGMVVTQDMANSITSTFSQMGEQVLTGMQEDHAEQLAQLTTFFQTSAAITEEQEQNVLTQLEKSNADQLVKYEEGKNRINEILNTAASEKREITESEKIEINTLQAEMVEEGIRTLSDGEIEFKTIMERMKSQSAEITAEQAIQTIADARKTKNDVVAEAEAQYADTLALIIRLRDESGTITAEQAQAMIDEATRQKDDVTTKADEMYSGVLEIAKEKGGEHLTENEIALGKQIGLWDEWAIDVTKAAAKTYAGTTLSFKNMAVDSAIWFNDLKKKGTQSFIEMSTTIDFVMNDVPKIVKRKMAQSVAEVTLKIVEFKNAGRDVVQGLINGMKEKINDIVTVSKSVGNSIIKTVSGVLQRKSPSRVMFAIGQDTSKGLALGIKNKENEVITRASNMSKALIDSAKKVLTQGAKQTNVEVASINKKASEEAKKIQKRASEDIYQIKKNAKSKKRKLTSAELLRIQRLEQDSSSKVKKINEKASSEIAKLNAKSGKERLDALKLFVEDKKQMEQLSLIDEVKIWEASVSSFKNGTKEKITAQKEYQKALKQVNDEVTSTNKEYSDKMKVINEDLKRSEQELTDKYNSTLNNRVNSLRSFSGLFDEFTYSMERSGSELLMNLNSQVEGFRTWQTEMDKFASKRVDSGLIEELREMGPKALPELLALNSLTDEHLTIYSNLYKDKTALARTQAEKELAGMKKDTEANIAELRKTANTELEKLRVEWVNKIKSITKATDDELLSLKQIGVNAGKGLLDGLASMEPALTAKARSIANSIQAAMKSALQVKSPSRVTMGIGKHIGEGLVVGMQQMDETVKNTAMQLARFATPSVDDQSYGSSVNRSNRSGVPPQNDRPIIIEVISQLDGREVARNQVGYINGMQYDSTSIAALLKGVSL